MFYQHRDRAATLVWPRMRQSADQRNHAESLFRYRETGTVEARFSGILAPTNHLRAPNCLQEVRQSNPDCAVTILLL